MVPLLLCQSQNPDGEFKDIAHPINSETREMIKNNIR